MTNDWPGEDPHQPGEGADRGPGRGRGQGPSRPAGSARANRRLFTPRQRLVLFAAADGHCEYCGVTIQVRSPGHHGQDGDGQEGRGRRDDRWDDRWDDHSYEADHVVPHGAGGHTDVRNGAAACRRCNRRKGARPALHFVGTEDGDTADGNTRRLALGQLPLPPWDLPLPPWDLPLRDWQRGAVQVWLSRHARGLSDMTVLACPGAGKTRPALCIGHRLLAGGHCSLIVIVVPTRQLKHQWVHAAHRAGITLTAHWHNGDPDPPPGVHGVVLTYAQVDALPDALRRLAARRRVFAVLDELHHGGRGRPWGDGLLHALDGAAARLCLSATPRRADGRPLPFVAYGQSGRPLAHVRYPYARALRAGDVRPAFFCAYDALAHWRDARGERRAAFADPLGRAGRARRLRTALDPAGGWMRRVLADAAAALRHAQGTHPRAAGLVVCSGAAHARAVAALLEEITGQAPALALGEDEGAGEVLEAFRRHGERRPGEREGARRGPRWLVVCRLAGEGYDCPDLRVGVWATAAITPALFLQVLGRLLRVVAGLPYQDALLFLPADTRLLALARAIGEGETEVAGPDGRPGGGDGRPGDDLDGLGGEWEDGLDEELEDGLDGERENEWGDSGAGGADPSGGGGFVALSSEATGCTVIAGGAPLPEAALRDACALQEDRAHRPALLLHALPHHCLAARLADVMTGRREFEDTGLAELLKDAGLEPRVGGHTAVEKAPGLQCDAAPGLQCDAAPGLQCDAAPGQGTPAGDQGPVDSGGPQSDDAGADDAGADDAETYDETVVRRRREGLAAGRLRRECGRLTARIAATLARNDNAGGAGDLARLTHGVRQSYERHRGHGLKDATLDQLQALHALLCTKLAELDGDAARQTPRGD